MRSERPPACSAMCERASACLRALGRGSSPDAHCSLDESGDTHTGEDGADELTDHVLVAAHTQRLSQKEGHSDGATEARQVMLR